MKNDNLKQTTKSRVTTLWRSIATLLALFLVAGCAPGSEKLPPDRSILSDQPCAAPCWQGIVPGTTTEAEAWDIVKDLEFIDPDKLWRPSGDIAWHSYASSENPDAINVVWIQEGTVSLIQLTIGFELTLKDVLDKYGPPEKYAAYMSSNVENIRSDVHFVYPQQGIIFTSRFEGYLPPSESLVLEPSTPVTLVHYFAPAPIDTLTQEYPRLGWSIELKKAHWKDWTGLGPVELVR